MSFAKQFGNKAQEMRGRIKRHLGEITGNRRLRSDGRADELKGNLKQAGEKVKDALRGRNARRRRQH